MSKESLEHLSSLMDGELSRETGLFMARRLSSDGELCGTWKRYHMIRDCLRLRGDRYAFADLASGIHAALDGAATEQAQSWDKPRWLKPAAGLAIAASVALLAINFIGPGPLPENEIPGVAGNPATTNFTGPDRLPVVPVSQPVNLNNASSARLNSYLMRHNQLARSSGSQAFVSFVPIILTRVAADDGAPTEPTAPAADPPVEEQATAGVAADERPGTVPESNPDQP